MMRYLAKAAAIALALVLTAGSAASAADATKKHHVILHVTEDDPVKWNQTLNNAGNLQSAVGKGNVEIEIVANGPGLNMMKFESPAANRMKDAMGNGISILACGATMKGANLTEKDLFPGVKVVPGGIVQIMLRQEAGWTYIKN